MQIPRYKSIIGCFCICRSRFRAETRFTNFRFIIVRFIIYNCQIYNFRDLNFHVKKQPPFKTTAFRPFTPQYAEFQLYCGHVHSPKFSSDSLDDSPDVNVMTSLFSTYTIVNKGLLHFSFILQNLLKLSFFEMFFRAVRIYQRLL